MWQKTPSYTKGKIIQIITATKKPEDEAAETPMEQEPKRPTRVVSISTIRPITRPNPEVALIESSSRPSLTDPILEIHIYNLTNDEIQEYLNKEEEIKKKPKEGRLLAMTKS
ncbi:hypothetical protein Tco_1546904 [Tanacetum coccineum]